MSGNYMAERCFAKRCGDCGQKTMALATIPYDITINHDGRRYDVHIDNFSVPKCTNCGAVSFDDCAGKQIDNEFRRIAGLLTPEQIREGRIKANYPNQQEFATCFGVSPSTVSRWENGSQVQQLSYDGWLRAFFTSPETRRVLARQHGLIPKDPPPVSRHTTIIEIMSDWQTPQTLGQLFLAHSGESVRSDIPEPIVGRMNGNGSVLIPSGS